MPRRRGVVPASAGGRTETFAALGYVLRVEAAVIGRHLQGMSTVEEIETAIKMLPRRELWQLKEHLDHQCEADWDAQIAEDARPGDPLDKLAQQAIAEFKAGHCTSLP